MAADKIILYNLKWDHLTSPISIEMHMVQKGGKFKKKDGTFAGSGLAFHFKRFQELLYGDAKTWHRWNTKQMELYLDHRTIGVIGPASCIHGSTRILNPISGCEPTVQELCESGVPPVVMTCFGPAQATVPFVKGVAKLFEVNLADGSRFVATGDHLCLSKDSGFCHVSGLQCGDLILSYSAIHPQTSSVICPSTHASNAQSSLKIAQGFQFDCPVCSDSCGEPPLPAPTAFQLPSPSPDDAPICMVCVFLDMDDLGNTRIHSHLCPHGDHQSILGSYSLSGNTEISAPRLPFLGSPEPCAGWSPLSEPSLKEIYLENSVPESVRDFSNTLPFCGVVQSCLQYKVQPVAVSSIRCIGEDVYFDLQVPGVGHYFAEGAIHHNSGKTNSAATDVLADYFCFPDQTTGLFCSTTRERLEDRVWGEVKKYYKIAKSRWSWLSGHLIEGRQRIVTDDRSIAADGRDFRNGLIGVPCKRGQDYVGLGDFIGIKNKRVRVVADELHLLPKVFVDMISNLDKNPDLKVVGLGNPKDTTDALGTLCEPAASLGGWDGGIDQTPGTKHWDVRRPDGVCLQLPGSDSPNLDGRLGIPLITQEQIDRDVSFYGKESLWFTMMNEGRMPRGQGTRRVLTRQLCLKFNAMDPPVWKDSNRTQIAFLDAAYRGVGGDRCIFGILEFGEELRPVEPAELLVSAIVDHSRPKRGQRSILALLETTNVPIKVASGEPAEDQIVTYVKNRCLAANIPPDNFFFDAGMRTSLVSAFARLWSPNVESVDCGGKPSERNVSSDIPVKACDYYSKFITELWFSVRMIVESGQFRGMTDDALTEFSSREWTIVGANKIEVEPKEKMKEKTGRSPDIADAIAIGIHGARHRGFIIARLKAPGGPNGHNDRWKDELRKKADKLNRSKDLVHSA